MRFISLNLGVTDAEALRRALVHALGGESIARSGLHEDEDDLVLVSMLFELDRLLAGDRVPRALIAPLAAEYTGEDIVTHMGIARSDGVAD